MKVTLEIADTIVAELVQALQERKLAKAETVRTLAPVPGWHDQAERLRGEAQEFAHVIDQISRAKS